MSNGKNSGIGIESFRPDDDASKSTYSERPVDRPSGNDKPVNIGGGSMIDKPASGHDEKSGKA